MEAKTINSVNEKDFVFILKRLIPPTPHTVLRINVIDTCCFIHGKPKFIAFS